jgi:RNA polymerase sigma factor (sigma-70 family)
LLSPAALLHAAANGDAQAWQEIVERYHRLVWSVARGYGLGQSDAADVSQTTWLRLVEHLGKIRQPENLAAWLATTARRESARVQQRARREVPSDTTTDDDAANPAEDGGDPAATLLAAEEHGRLRAAFARLNERCQLLLRALSVSPDDSYAEVAAALDMPVGSIGPTRSRCLDKLKRLLHEPVRPHDTARTRA